MLNHISVVIDAKQIMIASGGGDTCPICHFGSCVDGTRDCPVDCAYSWPSWSEAAGTTSGTSSGTGTTAGGTGTRPT